MREEFREFAPHRSPFVAASVDPRFLRMRNFPAAREL
jgi:hypothetical protein